MAEADRKKVLQSFNEIIAKSDKPTIPYASAELLDTTHLQDAPAHKLLNFALKREMRRLDYAIPKEDSITRRAEMRKRLDRVENLIIRLRLKG